MIDFSKFDLDAPLPRVTTNASRASFEAYLSGDGTRTLREMMLDPGSGGLDFVGTPDSIAAEMEAVMQEIGGDGFLIHDPLTRKAITEIADGLAPALKRRGLLQSAYPQNISATICWRSDRYWLAEREAHLARQYGVWRCEYRLPASPTIGDPMTIMYSLRS